MAESGYRGRVWGSVALTLAAAAGLVAPNVSCNGKDGHQIDEQCESCHDPGGKGIEEAHAFAPLTCTECHGGDPNAKSAEEAHVAKPPGIDSIRGMPTDQIDTVPEDYIRFINPGDLRVAQVGCGGQNSAAGEGSCHESLVDSTRRSVMSTFVGHYNVPRYLAGLQGHDAIYGSRDMVHEGFDGGTAPQGAVGSIAALRPPPDGAAIDMQTVMDHYLVKSCPTCHAYSFGKNDAPGNYRSSGCTSCHMIYENDGISRSDDPTIPKTGPSHAAKHELTSAIPVYQCEHCHFQGARIGLLYQGIREGGFADAPPNAVPLGEPLHDHTPDFYFTDEDSTNSYDETPPDLHATAGMSCVDCHVGSDVHGDGNMYSTAKFQVGIRCEDCHGTVRAAIIEQGDGLFHASAGHPLRQLRRNENGVIVLVSRLDEREHVVKQVKEVIDSGANPRMNAAMAVDAEGFTHTDSLECHACHSSYRQNCFGCHVEINFQFTDSDHQTGTVTKGLRQVRRDWYDLDLYMLGTNNRGKISSACPSQQVFVSARDESGNVVMDEQVRTTANGMLGFGWQPNNPHTVHRVPQNCDRCHIRPDDSNIDAVRATYGFGNGQFMLQDGEGNSYDLSRILDDMGQPIVDFGHEGAGPVPMDVINRALSIRVEPQPR